MYTLDHLRPDGLRRETRRAGKPHTPIRVRAAVAAIGIGMAATLVFGTVGPAHAAGLLDGLKGAATEQLGGIGGSGGGAKGEAAGGMLGSLGLPSMGASTAGNAAGVVQYCIKNKYLSGGASGVKDSLLRKAGLGGKEDKDPGYQSGLSGMLSGSDGKSFDMSKIQSSLKEKACDYVLDNAKSLL